LSILNSFIQVANPVLNNVLGYFQAITAVQEWLIHGGTVIEPT